MKFPVIPTINLVLKTVDNPAFSEEFESWKALEEYCFLENETIYRCGYSNFLQVAERKHLGDERVFKDYFLDNFESILDDAGYSIVKVVRG
jgi:hypothetical protein